MKSLSLTILLLLSGLGMLAQNQRFLIDFGKDDVANGNITISPDINGNHWNNMLDVNASAPQLNLVDITNQSSSIYLQVTQGFLSNGIQNGGLLVPDSSLLGEFAIATATQDYFFVTGSGALDIGGLTPGNGYVFQIFATRNQGSVRTSRYTFTGLNTYVDTLQTSGVDLGGAGYNGNNSTVMTTDTIYADASGIISLGLSIVQGGFGYLGLMQMEEVVDGSVNNRAPIVDAGADVFLQTGTTADSLRGSALDLDGDSLSYTWTQIEGPMVAISDPSLPNTEISGLSDGNSYSFELSVSDGNLNAADTLKITVREPKVSTSIRSFFFDFGPNDVANGNITTSPDQNGNHWNNLIDPASGANPVNLVDALNGRSNIEATMVTSMVSNGIQNGGLLAPEDSLLGDLAIATATQDYFFTTGSGTIAIEDLNPGLGYIFTLFGSRNTASVRTTQYTLSGATTVIDTLQSSGPDIGGVGYNGNNRNVVVTPLIRPDAQGTITIELSVIEGGFAYLNMMKMDEVFDNPKFLVDFGKNDTINGNLTPSPDPNGNHWNNLFDPSIDGDTVFLVDAKNNETSKYLKAKTTFGSNGIQNGGLLAPADSLLGALAIATATEDYFFLSGTNTGTIEFGGLDTTLGYVFSVFGTRNSGQRRVTTYTFTGEETYIDSLQTSGVDLGGPGYNGNNRNLVVTDTLYPNTDGIISLSFTAKTENFAYLGMMQIEEIVPVEEPEPESLIAVMGSSVADGFGATNSQGYAYLYNQLLNERFDQGLGREYDYANISIGGNSTVDVTNRWDNDLAPLNGDYVIYGLSLGNEGIRGNGQAAFDQFRDNMLALIDRARDAGIEPVVVNCYARADFDATDYQFTKDMNMLIHSWPVASFNVLGGIDDGQGRWATGYEADPFHPNDAGYAEMYYTMVPSLFDALQAGKPQPKRVENTYITIDKAISNDQLEFTPDATIHPFTISFDIRTTGRGVISAFTTDDAGYGGLRITNQGSVTYESTGTNGIVGSDVINDSTWHEVTLTHYYAKGKTYLYVDGMLQGEVAEQLEPDAFSLSEINGPSADYRDWFFYRSGMNQQEIEALVADSMLKSSLELYAPLDGQEVLGSDPLVNLAMSTNSVAQVEATQVVTSVSQPQLDRSFEVFPNPSREQTNFEFMLEAPATVKLNIYDLQGRHVRTLVNAYLPTGEHQVTWSVQDMPRQLYIAVLEVANQRSVQKLWVAD